MQTVVSLLLCTQHVYSCMVDADKIVHVFLPYINFHLCIYATYFHPIFIQSYNLNRSKQKNVTVVNINKMNNIPVRS